jgi:PAS domain S-box-containing protein
MWNTTQTKRVTPASRDTLFTILETLPGAFFVLDETDTVMYANASAQTMLDATPEALHGHSFWRAAPQLVSAALYQAVQQTRQTRASTEVQYRSPVTRTWLHVQLSPTIGGLLVQVHQGRAARTAAPCQERFPQGECLCLNDLDGLYSGIIVLTPEGIVLEINEVPLAEAQIRREEVIGLPLAETRWWPSSPASQAQLRAAITQASMGETVRFETVVSPGDGIDRHLDIAITPRMDAEHHIEYLVLAGIDITARKRAEAEIYALIDTIPHLVWMMRPDGSGDYCNQQWCDYTNMTREHVQGDGWLRSLHPDDQPRLLAAWQHAVQTGTPCEVEYRLRNGRTGAYRWFLARALPHKDAQGTILQWVGTSTDIDDRKRVEQRLKESEENWRVLAETVPQLVWTTSPDGRVEYWNQRWYTYTGSSLEHALGHGWSQFLHPDEYQHTLTVWHQALETGEPYEIKYRLKDGQTGGYRWFLARGMPVRDETGQIVKWFGTCTDIDEQKQAEQKIKASEENLRVLAETVPQLVWTKRPDGQFAYTNQRWRDYTGSTLEQLQSDQWAHLQFLHPDDHEGNRAHWLHALDTGDMFEYEQRLRNAQTGEYRWFLVRAMPVRDEAGQIVKWFGTSTDIEEQKRIEAALRQSQERASVLMNSSIIGIFLAEGEQIVDANDSYLRMTGYTREDLREGHISWMRMTPPAYLARTQQAQQELVVQQYGTPYEKEYVCKDGSRLPVVVGVVALRRDPLHTIGFVLDNSARKELEQRKDDFISMASHELKTPLTALKLQTALLHRKLAKQGIPASAPALSSMETQINKVTRLVEELLDVSKIQAGRLEYQQETVDLDALLREITETMQQTHSSHRILVRGTVGTSLIGDPDRLGQVFINLLSNAIKYSPDAKTVEVDLSTSEDVVTIRVRDHGLGIPRELRDKIFDRFYRVTDPRQRAIPGLGMGLYIVAEIVEHHGGTISVESEVGEGSTFTVTLPRNRDT